MTYYANQIPRTEQNEAARVGAAVQEQLSGAQPNCLKRFHKMQVACERHVQAIVYISRHNVKDDCVKFIPLD